MEELAENLCLLGLPFLLSKAADAAADHEAQGSKSTAAAFAAAAKAVSIALKHPDLATLDMFGNQAVYSLVEDPALSIGPSRGSLMQSNICRNKTPAKQGMTSGKVVSLILIEGVEVLSPPACHCKPQLCVCFDAADKLGKIMGTKLSDFYKIGLHCVSIFTSPPNPGAE